MKNVIEIFKHIPYHAIKYDNFMQTIRDKLLHVFGCSRGMA